MLRKILIALAATACATAAAHAGRVDNRLGYDPHANPFDQYHTAIEQAKAEHKRVLIIAGGDWCRWCYALDRFITRNDDVSHALHDAFVIVKVYVGDENFNEFFFSQLPEARGAPHFWVVSPDRNVLASQSTGSFEHGRSDYDKTAFMGFVAKWRP